MHLEMLRVKICEYVLTFSHSPAFQELILFDFWAMVQLMSMVLSLGSRGGVVLDLPSCKDDELSWRGQRVEGKDG